MRTSCSTDLQGRFLGVAVTQAGGWWIVATDPAVQDINSAISPSQAEAQCVASLLTRRHS